MAIWDKVKGQLRSVIEWENPNPDSLFYKWTDDGNEIKNASKLIVGPGQGCIFVHEGKLEAVITDQGITDLKTANIPFWTTISSFMQKFQSEHKVGIYFFKTTEIVDQKWGTPSVIKYQDPTYKFPVGLRAFGNFSFRIADPGGFFTEIVGAVNDYYVSDFNNMMKSRMLGPLADFFAESKFSYADIDAQRNELSDGIKGKLIDEFVRLGFEITDFKIEGTSFDEDTMKRINRIADMTAEAQAAAAVGLNYADMQKLDALKAAAANEGGAAGMGMGMGAGMGMGQMMAGMMGGQQNQAAPAADDPAAKLGKLKQMLDNGFITQEEFDAKKKEILASM
ncbi:MAG: SPFH domain-containing protein [Spirochaetes bacterium]|nr:SPFH domain-containing protein [Spirochaetota bacterium]